MEEVSQETLGELFKACQNSWPVDYKDVSAISCASFLSNLWLSESSSLVPKPPGMTLETANQWASIVLERRQRWLNTQKGDSVFIKNVAEIRGSRFNNGKTRYDLLNWEALAGLANVLEFGATKYSAHNWMKGLPVTEILASMLRHVAAIQNGEDVDPETGLPHADHIQCNAMFLSWMMKNRADMDDRHTSYNPIKHDNMENPNANLNT